MTDFGRISICAIFLCGLLELALSSGKLEVWLESYENPSNDRTTGDCCVTGTSYCRQSCDNTFQVCVSSTSSSTASDCNVGRTDIEHVFSDSEKFGIGELETRLTNPLTYSFDQWKNDFEFKFTVNHNKISRVVILQESINLASQQRTNSTWTQKTLAVGMGRRNNNKKTLVFSLRVTCDDDYRGNNCTLKTCIPHDDNESGHYTCTSEHEKVCLPGWTGNGCTVKQCTPRDDESGHFKCNSNNTIECLHGWVNTTTNCTIMLCVPRDNVKGHFSCDEHNTKVCLLGWKDLKSNCTVENTTVIPTSLLILPTSSFLTNAISTKSTSLSSSGFVVKPTTSMLRVVPSMLTTTPPTLLTTTTITTTTTSTTTSTVRNTTLTTTTTTTTASTTTSTVRNTTLTTSTKTTPTTTTNKNHPTNIVTSVNSLQSERVMTTFMHLKPSIQNTISSIINSTMSKKLPTAVTSSQTNIVPTNTPTTTTITVDFETTKKPRVITTSRTKGTNAFNEKETKNLEQQTAIIIGCVVAVVVATWIIALLIIRRHRQKMKVLPANSAVRNTDIISSGSIVPIKETKISDDDVV